MPVPHRLDKTTPVVRLCRTHRGGSLRLGLTLVCILLGALLLADRAVVVGVDSYPGLPADSQLHGAVSDATAVKTMLESKFGMEVTLLADSKATAEGIKAALWKAAKEAKPGEQFVFYFAGHGTHTPGNEGAILTADSKDSSAEHDITATELKALVGAIPAAGRTVILDSCFSGAMSKGIDGNESQTTLRYYARDHSKSLQTVDDDVKIKSLKSDGTVCYFTAASPNEPSGEREFAGQVHGLFTYCLSRNLEPGRTWRDIESRVAQSLSDLTSDRQHPTLTSGFGPYPAFSARTDALRTGHGTGSNIALHTGRDAYSEDNPNGERLDLEMDPDRPVVKLHQDIRLTCYAKSDGYLVVLDRDEAGTLQVIWPKPGAGVAASHVEAGSIVPLPGAGKAFSPDTAGNERVKAVWFSSKAKAQSLLDAFGSKSFKLAESENLILQKVADEGEVVTASIEFEVVAPGVPK